MSDEEEVTAQLLRLAGTPPDPAADRTARVRAAVHREWRAGRRRRTARRWATAALAVLAVAASLVIGVRVNRPRSDGPPPTGPTPVIGIAGRIQGQPIVRRDLPGGSVSNPLLVSTAIHAGDVVETDGASRASLQAADGTSVRMDRDSRLRFIAPGAIEVIAGAVYVATAPGSRGFEVRTPTGTIRDIGTRFEVRLTGTSLRVRVRAGGVEIQRGASVTTTRAGSEATVTADAVAVRQVPAYGSDWDWTADLAPAFAIEGRPLYVFLEHIVEEHGWSLRYADSQVADAARRAILHGSVDGLRVEEALSVTLATSGLQYQLRGGVLLVSGSTVAR